MGLSCALYSKRLENMNIPIPSEIILGFAGFLVPQGVFSFWPTILIGTPQLDRLLGLRLHMGHKGRRDILRHTQKGAARARKNDRRQNWFETYGGIAVFTGRLLRDPYLHFFSLRHRTISPSKFTILTIIGTIPWTIFLVYMGAMLEKLAFSSPYKRRSLLTGSSSAPSSQRLSISIRSIRMFLNMSNKTCIPTFPFCLVSMALFPVSFLIDPDEPVYGETAKKCLPGDWLPPRIYGEFWVR